MGVMGDPGASSLYIFLHEISPSHRTDFQFLSPMQARHWSQTPAFYCVSGFSVHKTSIYFSPSKPSPLQGICSSPVKVCVDLCDMVRGSTLAFLPVHPLSSRHL